MKIYPAAEEHHARHHDEQQRPPRARSHTAIAAPRNANADEGLLASELSETYPKNGRVNPLRDDRASSGSISRLNSISLPGRAESWTNAPICDVTIKPVVTSSSSSQHQPEDGAP